MKKEKKDKHFIKKPVYPGGSKALKEFVKKELKYPIEALENRIEGTVRLKYDIDYKGNVVETYILNGVGHGCDEEAERIVKKLKFHVDKTRKVKVIFHKNISINFRLPKEKPKKAKAIPPPKITSVQYNYTTSPDVKNKPSEKITYNYSIKVK